jgi:hypothetical protein
VLLKKRTPIFQPFKVTRCSSTVTENGMSKKKPAEAGLSGGMGRERNPSISYVID